MNVNPGELKHKIIIKKYQKKTDESVVIRECWAKVNDVTGKKITINDLDIESISTRFLVRYSSIPIDNSMEIYFDSKIYKVKYTNNFDNSKRYTEIFAEFKEWNREN